ncbi:MAG: DUF2007 domain-containing protein [Bacteroidetes bacterium]|nr:DUF2007 domain-containing protein [Bacteroidota bacterium]
MSKTQRIFTGPDMIAKGLIARLNEIGINPIERKEHNSATMAGFAASIPQQTQLFLMEDELDKAKNIIETYLAEIG